MAAPYTYKYPVLCGKSHLQHFIGLLSSFVVGGPDAEVLLVLLAVHALVNGLTGQTVLLLTDWTREEVDQVLVDTPARAVIGLAVEAVPFLALCCHQTALEMFLVNADLHQLLRSS